MEIRTKSAQVLFGEYLSRIFFAVWGMGWDVLGIGWNAFVWGWHLIATGSAKFYIYWTGLEWVGMDSFGILPMD